MVNILSDHDLDILFRNARSQNGWLDVPVSDVQLQALYDLLRWGPTSANCSPARFVFVRDKAAKAQLINCVSEGNAAKVQAAPVTVIIGYDQKFYDKIPQLFPHMPSAREWFTGNAAFADATAFRNGTLQGAYLIIAARAIGLDCGPMSGFDNVKVDAAFFDGTTIKSNFICSLGTGDPDKLYPRSPRLSFDEACKVL